MRQPDRGQLGIPALSNNALRAARQLRRAKGRQVAGEFLVEGRQAVAEALANPGVVSRLLVGVDTMAQHSALVADAVAAGVPVATVTAATLTELADTVTPQGVLAVCRQVDLALDEVLGGPAPGSSGRAPHLVVFCNQIRDPGNLGTVIRCADAFGADAVLVSAGSVDLYNPKTVRATTGSIFHLPIVTGVELPAAVAAARAAGILVLGAEGTAKTRIDELADSGELGRPTLWVLGNEAWGLPAADAALLDQLVALPIYGKAESLNLATAAAVLLYASATAQHAVPVQRRRPRNSATAKSEVS